VPNTSATARRGGRPALEEAAQLTAAILAAAEAAFLAEGFSRASIASIATAAGTSKQTVHARFGSKERLFIAVSNKLLSGRFVARAPKGMSLRDSLIHVAIQTLDAMLDPKMVMMNRIIVGEAERFPELARLADDDSSFPGRALVQQLLSNAAEGGELACDDPHRAMLMLLDLVLATPLRRAARDPGGISSAERHEWAARAVDLFLDGMRPR